jgi:hypothetical protein
MELGGLVQDTPVEISAFVVHIGPTLRTQAAHDSLRHNVGSVIWAHQSGSEPYEVARHLPIDLAVGYLHSYTMPPTLRLCDIPVLFPQK